MSTRFAWMMAGVAIATGAPARVQAQSFVPVSGGQRVGDSGLRGISLSADGTFVAFASRAQLVDADMNSCTPPMADEVNCSDIYVRNRTTGAMERVSVASDGTEANGESGEPSISADGRFIVFTSSASSMRTRRRTC